jgi:exocyst complex component 2
MGNTKDAVASKIAEKQQQRILEKVWKSIEKAMVEMKNVLVAQLQDTNRTVEEQEKTLELAFFLHLKIVTYFSLHIFTS